MGVYIRGMEMPKSSRRCPFTEMDDWGMRCTVGGKYEWHKDRLCDECPLAPVPPHGRLIDADALEELVIKQKYACAGASAHGSISELHKSWGLHDAELMIEAAPTIIPAEEDEA